MNKSCHCYLGYSEDEVGNIVRGNEETFFFYFYDGRTMKKCGLYNFRDDGKTMVVLAIYKETDNNRSTTI